MIEDYLEAKKLGDRSYRNALLFGQTPYLPALDEKLRKEDIQGENRLGILEIPLEDIAGTKTKARQQYFSRNFYKRSIRWNSTNFDYLYIFILRE